MSTASEIILERYKRTWTETDSFGRTIVIGQIRVPQELAVLRMVESPDRTNQVTYLAAACIRQIDENLITPPRQLADLDAILRTLDHEGIEALGKAYARMKEEVGAAKTDEEAKAEVKN